MILLTLDDNLRIQSEIEELIKQFVNEDSFSEPQLRKLSDLVKSQRGYSKLNRRKLIDMLSDILFFGKKKRDKDRAIVDTDLTVDPLNQWSVRIDRFEPN
jgi:hypothetical protein